VAELPKALTDRIQLAQSPQEIESIVDEFLNSDQSIALSDRLGDLAKIHSHLLTQYNLIHQQYINDQEDTNVDMYFLRSLQALLESGSQLTRLIDYLKIHNQ
jgi:hypothetical protein